MKWTFTVGLVLGAVRTTAFGKSARWLRCAAYKRDVRLIATASGVPLELDPKKSYRVDMSVLWKAKARVDGDNAFKAITDALWKQDRRILRFSYEAYEHQKQELVTVSVQELTTVNP